MTSERSRDKCNLQVSVHHLTSERSSQHSSVSSHYHSLRPYSVHSLSHSESSPVDHRSTDCGVRAYWLMNLCQSIHNSYFHAMRAQNYICIFSHYSSNIDPKSTENPATWRAARMHDFGISIFRGQNHRQKKHPCSGVLSFALTARSGGLGTGYSCRERAG